MLLPGFQVQGADWLLFVLLEDFISSAAGFVMVHWLSPSQPLHRKNWLQKLGWMSGSALLAVNLWTSAALAQDPFRTSNPRPISDRTEAAFKAFFAEGNYVAAANYLKQVDGADPLATAMKASLSYLNWQGEKDAQKQAAFLQEYRTYSAQTRKAAEKLLTTDQMRGNLYLAVSHFLDGAYVLITEGTVKGSAQALSELKNVYQYLDKAEAIAPNDPELNLLKGYVDLLTALNLPFANPNKAIDRLNKYAGPRYLADRGIALGYRDLNEQTKALEAVNRALQATPNNPELLYLKAQILVKQGNHKEGVSYFEKALKKQDQLPPMLVKQINRELSRAKRKLENSNT